MIRNVVVVVLDDVPGSDWTDFMPWLTAQTDWVVMPNWVLNAPVCAPSRATMFTGQTVQRHGVVDNTAAVETFHAGLPERSALAGVLYDAGVHCALVGKYENGSPWSDTDGVDGLGRSFIPYGWADWRSFFTGVGSGRYENYALMENGTQVNYGEDDEDYSTDVLFAHAVDIIGSAPDRFFLWVATNAPHATAVSATRHAALYDSSDIVRPDNFNEADISDKPSWVARVAEDPLDQTAIDALDAEHLNALRALKAVDEGIEGLIGALTTAGTLEQTVVMVLADNANLYGEHRIDAKPFMYEESIRAPLFVRWPGVAGRTEAAMIGNIDLAPTVAAVFGARMRNVQGQDMGSTIRGDRTETGRRDLLIQRAGESVAADQVSDGVVSSDGWKYVSYPEVDEEEMYDLDTDPAELVNVAASNTAQATIMRARLARLLAEQTPA